LVNSHIESNTDELFLILGEMGANVDAVIRVAAVEARAHVAELADPVVLDAGVLLVTMVDVTKLFAVLEEEEE
jgi:hypothetical protein